MKMATFENFYCHSRNACSRVEKATKINFKKIKISPWKSISVVLNTYLKVRVSFEMNKCEICQTTKNARSLGPFIVVDGYAVHYHCAIFSSKIEPDSDRGEFGITSRFIRAEVKRARNLVIFFRNLKSDFFFIFLDLFPQQCSYCKRNGANIGCCHDIGTDAVLKFCPRRYHVYCGMEKNASFTLSGNCGPVSLCFEHRDPIEKWEQTR